MSDFKRLLLLLMIIAGTANLSSASFISVFYDSFDADTRHLGTTTLLNWNVTAGNVDVLGPTLYDMYPGHGNYVDLDGTPTSTVSPGHTNATIETKIAFSPGTYKLTFLLANTPVGSTQINGLTVTIDSSASTSFPAPSATVFTQETAYFFAPTAGSLQFVQTGTANAQGSVIDDVHLFLIVPEPSAQLLIGSGLLALGFLLRRRLAQLS